MFVIFLAAYLVIGLILFFLLQKDRKEAEWDVVLFVLLLWPLVLFILLILKLDDDEDDYHYGY